MDEDKTNFCNYCVFLDIVHIELFICYIFEHLRRCVVGYTENEKFQRVIRAVIDALCHRSVLWRHVL